jgi:CheY-like chemotaxis protein
MTELSHPADVLVVDDEADVRDCLAGLLRREGFVVASAADGREALHYLCGGAPAPRLVLLDLAMPGVDGWKFLLARRCNPRLAAVPVVVFSAVNGLGGTDPRALGADAVLDKPTDLQRVVEAARWYCSARVAAGRGTPPPS